MSLTQGDLTDRQYYSLHERGVRAAVSDKACSQDLLDLLSMLLDKDVEARTSAAGALNESRWLVAPGSTSVDTSVTSTARLRVALENDLNVRVSRAALRERAALAKALFDRDVARRAAKVAPAETKPSVFNPRRKLRGSIQAVILTNRIAKHNVLAREDVATLMDLREALATVVTAEDETPLRGALDALWASDLPPTTMLHVRRIQTGNVAGLGEGKRVSCEE